MTTTQLCAFATVAAALIDTRIFTAREAHLGVGHKFQTTDTFTTPDGAKFVWCEVRRLFVRSV